MKCPEEPLCDKRTPEEDKGVGPRGQLTAENSQVEISKKDFRWKHDEQ